MIRTLRSQSRQLLAVAFFAAGLFARSAPAETQSFDDAPSTAAAGWSGSGNASGPNSYGFAGSNNAGGLAGEAGGTLAVRTTDFTHYADLTLGGSMNQQTALAASGKLTVTDFNFDGGFELGFFNSGSTTKATGGGVGGVDQAIVIRVLEAGRVTVRGGNEAAGSSPVGTFAANEDYAFNLLYDPNGVIAGTGLLTAEFRRQSDNSLVDTRTVSFASTGAPYDLNAFGIVTLDFDRDDTTTGFFIDDLSYSEAMLPPPPPVIPLGMESQSFDNSATTLAAGWAGNRNRDGELRTDYGFSASNNAGMAVGEAGGAVPGRTAVVSSYADTTLGGSLTQKLALSASGRFTLTSIAGLDGGFELGFFDANTLDGTPAFIGARLVDGTPNSVRWWPHRDVNGSSETGGETNQLMVGEDYLFTLAYDPAGGGPGVGRVSLEFIRASDSVSLGVRTLDFSSLGSDVDLNAFGLKTLDFNANVGGSAGVFLDDLNYTVIIPEPMSLALATTGVVLLLARRLRYVSRRR